MQNEKVIIMTVSLLLLSSCNLKSDGFKQAIEQATQQGITSGGDIGKGHPFFIKHTLTPTWDTDTNIVSIPDFKLINHHGELVEKNIFENKISIVAFLFTSCAGFCPVIVQNVKKIEKAIGAQKNVQYIIVSVDPEVDSPEVLTQYAQAHKVAKPNWTFLTGKKQDIYDLSRSTFASEIRKIDAKNMRKFAHTDHFYLIDQQGRLRDILNGTRIDLAESAAKSVHQLVQTQPIITRR